MSIARAISHLGVAVGILGCFAVFTPGEASAAGGPAVAPAPKTNPAAVRISKASVHADIERATGPVAAECKGSQAALQAYNACKEKCATAAQNAPITPAELEKCGNESAEDCGQQLVASRSHACLEASAPTGCKDDFHKLQVENAECKSCNDLKAAAEKAVQSAAGQARVVSQAEAALNRARAQLAVLDARVSALTASSGKVCAEAQKGGPAVAVAPPAAHGAQPVGASPVNAAAQQPGMAQQKSPGAVAGPVVNPPKGSVPAAQQPALAQPKGPTPASQPGMMKGPAGSPVHAQ